MDETSSEVLLIDAIPVALACGHMGLMSLTSALSKDHVGLTRAKMRTQLKHLINLGIVEMVGTRRWATYKLKEQPQ